MYALGTIMDPYKVMTFEGVPPLFFPMSVNFK